jgi:hypothetical protein
VIAIVGDLFLSLGRPGKAVTVDDRRSVVFVILLFMVLQPV